jgi:DNA-binding transcriptional LysR family regulator
MRGPATPSIDQLLVLLAVAEAGSFTAAAKRLGRATSAISYRRLLRTRRKWPRSRRTTQNTYEIPPPHVRPQAQNKAS